MVTWSRRVGWGLVAAVSAMLMCAAGGLGCIGPNIADGTVACDDGSLCPTGFECAIDGRCYRYAGVCEDAVLDPGETCDPPGTCPTSCNDGNSCSRDTLLGAPETCNSRCSHGVVEACQGGDGCCPSGCGAGDDSDCLDSCGNGQLDPGETCEGESCDDITCNDGDACTNDVRVGSKSNCNVACVYQTVDTCIDGDGCCAAGCNSNTDTDCSPLCGNGEIDYNEFCDPPSSCPEPSDCNDNTACTVDEYRGSPETCTARCVHTGIVSCIHDDGCCPTQCTEDMDSDCVSETCGNGSLDAGETCDDSTGSDPCPTTCASADKCVIGTLVGSASQCTAECIYGMISECGPDDGCCPNTCSKVEYGFQSKDPDCATSN